VLARLPLPHRPAAVDLAPVQLPALPGHHDLCVRFARPALEPLWALDWIAVGE